MKPFTFWMGLLGAAALLAICHFVSGWMIQKSPDSSAWQRFHRRSRDWWWVLGAIAISYAIGPGALIFIFACASFMALREVITVTPVKPSDANPLFVAFFIAVPVQYLLLAIKAYSLFSIFIPVYIFFALTALSIFAQDKEDFLARNARVQWALMVTVYGVSFAPALLRLDPTGMLFFYFLFIGQIFELTQFTLSRWFGDASKEPRLAAFPSLTLRGAGGAILLAGALGAALHTITPFSWWQSALAAMAIAVSGLCGSLAINAAKRSLGVSQWRPFSEANGGMMERLDAVCFSAPIFFHIAKSFYPS